MTKRKVVLVDGKLVVQKTEQQAPSKSEKPTKKVVFMISLSPRGSTSMQSSSHVGGRDTCTSRKTIWGHR